MTRQVVELLVPLSYRYLLWSAENQSGLFKDVGEKKKCKKNQKYLLYENQARFSLSPTL